MKTLKDILEIICKIMLQNEGMAMNYAIEYEHRYKWISAKTLNMEKNGEVMETLFTHEDVKSEGDIQIVYWTLHKMLREGVK